MHSYNFYWLSFYICVFLSIYLGFLEKPFYHLLLVASYFFVLHVVIERLYGSNNSNGKTFMKKKRFYTYSFNDLISQYLLSLVIFTFIYYVANFFSWIWLK